VSKKITIDGVPIEVVSDSEAEEADFHVCVPADSPSPFDDNLTGFCAHCGIKIIYRWHAPRTPPKICLECAAKMAAKLPSKP
jgi:hypothetical protein